MATSNVLTKLDSGWYVAIGIVGTIALSSTPASPYLFGLMVVASIYQLNKIVGGVKPIQPRGISASPATSGLTHPTVLE